MKPKTLNSKPYTLHSKLSTLHRLPNSLAKLIGAGGAFESTADAFQPLEYLINFHAIHQSAHALRVAIAAAIELHVLQYAVLDFKLNGLAAGALGAVCVFHKDFKISYFLFQDFIVALRHCEERSNPDFRICS